MRAYSCVIAKPSGMGMGLAVSRTIVEAHGGRIWVEDDHGRGTHMCLTLPISEGGES